MYDDSGQVCLAGTRLIVADEIADDFIERFQREVDAHVLGDPREPETTLSPLIHPDHLARVEGFVERAREARRPDRLRRPARRGRRSPTGLWYEPTLIEPASNDSEIVQREVFGPVLTFQTFAERGGGDRARQLDRVRALGDRLHRLGRARRAGRAARSAPAPSGSTPSSSAT